MKAAKPGQAYAADPNQAAGIELEGVQRSSADRIRAGLAPLLGRSLLETEGGDKELAVKHLRSALSLDPRLPGGRAILAKAYLAAGDAEANAYLERPRRKGYELPKV